MKIARALPVFLLLNSLLFLAGCQKEKEGPVYRVIGEAYAGPNQLSIREDLSLRSRVVAQVEHGAKLEVLDRKRRFVQVRSKDQKIGWVDMRLLISDKQMDYIEAMAKQYKDAPSMGKATVFDMLNVHIEANRYSPTFLQVAEKESVDIIGHQVVERKPYEGEGLELEDDSAPKKPLPRKKKRKDPPIAPPPPPPAPGLPPDWLSLSRTPKEAPPEVDMKERKDGKKREAAASNAPLVPMDDLTLIRTKNGRVGWVVSNALFLEVPDEVAQYAEGKRITSYFAVGEVSTESGKKQHWLWTTQSQKYAPFEFDGLRLFTYSTRRNRYETSYRERDLKGFFPILIEQKGGLVQFRVVVEGENGKLIQKLYEFDGNRVKGMGKADYVAPDNAIAVSAREKPKDRNDISLIERLKNFVR